MFGWDLMWRSCHLASICLSFVCNMAIWRGLMWKPPRNRVHKTWFLIGDFLNLMLCLSNPTHPLTLSASSVKPSPSLSLIDPDPLSLTLSFSHSFSLTDANTDPLTLSASSSLLSHSPFTVTQSPVYAVSEKKKKKKRWVPSFFIHCLVSWEILLFHVFFSLGC